MADPKPRKALRTVVAVLVIVIVTTVVYSLLPKTPVTKPAKLVDAAGAPVSGAKIKVHRGSKSAEVTTDAKGGFDLPNGPEVPAVDGYKLRSINKNSKVEPKERYEFQKE